MPLSRDHAALLLSLLLAACSRQVGPRALPVVDTLPKLDLGLSPATRLLVVAPHPDDEAIGAAGLIQQVVAAGGSVEVAVLTSGDGFPEGVQKTLGRTQPRPADYRAYGAMREAESRSAMAGLGVGSEHVHLLGFPDGGLCQLAARHLTVHRAYQSPFTDRWMPPPQERLIRGTEYRPNDVIHEIARLLVATAPTIVAYPDEQDEHPDHCAASIFTREALDLTAAGRRRSPRLLRYLVHYPHWPPQTFELPLPMTPPAGFPAGAGPWVSIPMTSSQTAIKVGTLKAYQSQMSVIGPFLLSFGRGNELFVEGRPRHRADCWCDDRVVAR